MISSQARCIETNQTGVHEDLVKVVAKHKKSDFKRPIAKHTLEAFNSMLEWLSDWQGELIIDACCGVGESTINIANQFPCAKVVGIDKSNARLHKHKSYVSLALDNYLLLQADLNDFWRLIDTHIETKSPKWHIVKQYILYPNPYPKKAQLGKRWHGSALFPTIINVANNIEVRSNWRLYLEEFMLAAECYGLKGHIEKLEEHSDNAAYTPFERKYLAANQTCFKLVIRPSGSDK